MAITFVASHTKSPKKVDFPNGLVGTALPSPIPVASKSCLSDPDLAKSSLWIRIAASPIPLIRNVLPMSPNKVLTSQTPLTDNRILSAQKNPCKSSVALALIFIWLSTNLPHLLTIMTTMLKPCLAPNVGLSVALMNI